MTEGGVLMIEFRGGPFDGLSLKCTADTGLRMPTEVVFFDAFYGDGWMDESRGVLILEHNPSFIRSRATYFPL